MCTEVGEENGHNTGREDGLGHVPPSESGRPGKRFSSPARRGAGRSSPIASAPASLSPAGGAGAPPPRGVSARRGAGPGAGGHLAISRPGSGTGSGCLSPAPPIPHSHLSQLQGALVLDAVVGQGQPEQGAIEPEALRGRAGAVSQPAGPRAPQVAGPRPLRTHVRDVARALVPDVVEAQVERDQGPVRGQSLAQEPRPVIVDAVVPQRQVRDPGQPEGEGGSRET